MFVEVLRQLGPLSVSIVAQTAKFTPCVIRQVLCALVAKSSPDKGFGLRRTARLEPITNDHVFGSSSRNLILTYLSKRMNV